MSFDPSLTFAGGYLTSSVINYFKIVDTAGNPICGASSASVNGSIAPYNGDYTQIRADQGWSPEDLGTEDIAAQYFGQAMNISINASDEEIAFKFKDASTGTLYNVTVTGDFNGVTFTNAAKVPVKESTAGGQYGGLGTLFGAAIEPIVFTVDLSGGGGGGDDGSFDPNLTFAGGYLTSSVINYFKIVDTAGNPICGASSASVNGSIAPYNGDYTQIRADQGWSPEDLGTEDIAAQYFGQAMNISINASDEEIAFKFKDASTGTLYNVTVTGDFNGVQYTNAAKVPVKESTAGGQYGGLGTLFGAAIEPIVFTVDLSGGGGSVDAPTAEGTFATITGLVQGTSATTVKTLSSIFTGDGISYTYSVTGSGVSAATSGDKVQVTASSDATAGNRKVTVTATNESGTATVEFEVSVDEANQPPQSSGEYESITVGKTPKGGTLYVENFKSKFSDPEGDTLTFTITSSATSVCRATENGNNIDLVFEDGMNIGESTISVTAVDASGSNTSISKTFTVYIIETKGVYVWTVSELQNSTMTTVLKMHIVDTNISIPGVHLKYNLTDASNYPNKPQLVSDYQQSSNNPWEADSAIQSKGWAHQMINTTTVGKEYIVLFDSVSKKLVPGIYDLMYFSEVKFDIEIIGLSDQHGNIISYEDVLNQAPPTIFEDTTVDKVTGKKYGDVNVDDLVNADDVEMLSRYLVRNNTQYNEPVSTESVQAITKMETEIAAFTATGTYVSLGTDAGGVEGSTGKAFSHIDVDKDGAISVADLCRLAEALENASYNIIG